MNEKTRKKYLVWGLILLILFFSGLIVFEIYYFKKEVPLTSIDNPEIISSVQNNQNKLLVIGVDGAVWKIILNLTGEGRLPAFRQIMERGARGILYSEPPLISPAIWTTYATGVSRKVHQIDNFVFKPKGSYETEPMDSRVREAPALWEIFSHFGKKVAVINWDAGAPAEPINGVFLAYGISPKNLTEEFVYPPEWIEKLKKIDPIQIKWFEEKLRGWNHPALSRGYEEDRFMVSCALEILKELKPDLMMIYLRNIDEVSHLFWRYRYPVGLEYRFFNPPQLENRFREVLDSYYQFTDQLISYLLKSARGYTVLILSDHGQDATYPPKNVFLEINLLLHKLGYLEYRIPRCEDQLEKMHQMSIYQANSWKESIFFDCQKLRSVKKELLTPANLLKFFQAQGKIQKNSPEVEKDLEKLITILTHPKEEGEIDWARTTLFNLSDFHKDIRGIYLNLKNREPEGVIEFPDFHKFRKQVIKELKALQGENGVKLFKRVWANPEKKEPIAPGNIDPPDILVEFNPSVLSSQYIYRSKSDTSPFFIASILWSYQDVSGDHIPEGIILFYGKDVRMGKISADIYNLAPTILWFFDMPVGSDMPGQVLKEAFNFPDKPIRYIKSYQGKIQIPVKYQSRKLRKEEKEKLRAVGYIK